MMRRPRRLSPPSRARPPTPAHEAAFGSARWGRAYELVVAAPCAYSGRMHGRMQMGVSA